MKKKLFVIALAISLVAILSLGSLAWFTDTDTVTNNFMVAQSDDDNPDDVFSVDVYEIKPDNTEEQVGLNFDDVLPGDELAKPAYVRNTGYYDQYIRVIITISDAQAWQAILNPSATYNHFNDAELMNVFQGFNASLWDMTNSYTEVNNMGTAATTDDVIRIVLYYKSILPGEQSESNADNRKVMIFNQINVPEELTRENVLLFDDDGTEGFSIDVKAEAIQTENVVPSGTPAGQEAHAAFDYIGWQP